MGTDNDQLFGQWVGELSLTPYVVGTLLSLLFIWTGWLISRRHRYNLIAGYNRASEEERKLYDIQGLGDHVGNGLITLGVMFFICLMSLALRFMIGVYVMLALFILTSFLIPIGARKFMPARQLLMQTAPSDARHPFLHWLLPEKTFRAIEAGTRRWIQVCRTCGHKQDFWEAGGVRYKAVGEPVKMQYCENCQKLRSHTIRLKTPEETAGTTASDNRE